MASPVEPLPGEDVLNEPTPAPVDEPSGEAGTHPAAEPPAEPEPTPPTPEDEPPAGTEDDEPEEWRYLADRFHKLKDDDKAFKKEIGKTFIEKSRFATEQRERADALEAENKTLRDEREAKPAEPAPPHPDVQRLEGRITRLQSRDEALFGQQERCLLGIAQCNEAVAVAKYQASQADEDSRAYYEDRVATLTGRKDDLNDRFKDLQGQRELLSLDIDDAQNQRDWTESVAQQQADDEGRERKDRAAFDKTFPGEVAQTMTEVADGLKIANEDREALKEFVLPRLAVQFWKLGQRSDLETVDVDALIETEIRRWHKTQDTRSRADFRTESEKRLAGRRPSPASPTPTPPPKPAGPSVPEPKGVKEVTALGLQDVSPSLLRGRKHLESKGL